MTPTGAVCLPGESVRCETGEPCHNAVSLETNLAAAPMPLQLPRAEWVTTNFRANAFEDLGKVKKKDIQRFKYSNRDLQHMLKETTLFFLCPGTGHMKTISSVWRDARGLFSSASRDRVFCYGLIILACTLLPRIYCFNFNWIPSFNTAHYQMDTYGSPGLLLLLLVLRWLSCNFQALRLISSRVRPNDYSVLVQKHFKWMVNIHQEKITLSND